VLVCASEKPLSPASDEQFNARDTELGEASLACASTAIVPCYQAVRSSHRSSGDRVLERRRLAEVFAASLLAAVSWAIV